MSINFSVIIPVYNREKIVGDAIESVLNQGYENLELIIVDDGSCDGTPEVLKQYENADSRVKVFIKDNGGVSSARNKGLDEAKGEYIIFLDSDDKLCPGVFSTIDKYIQQYGAIDVLAYGYKNNVNSTIFLPKGFPFNEVLVLDDGIRKQMASVLLGFSNNKIVLPVYCHGKAYRREFFDKHNIRFDTELLTWEDGLFSLSVVKEAKSFLFMDTAFYEMRNVADTRLSSMYYLDTVKHYAYRHKLFEEMLSGDFDFTCQERYDLQFKTLNLQITKVLEKNEDPDFSVVKIVLSDPYIVNIYKKAKANGAIEKRIAKKVCNSDLAGVENLYHKLSKQLKRRIFFEKVRNKICSYQR